MNVFIENPDSKYYIKHYKDNCLQLNTGKEYTKSLLLQPDSEPKSWSVNSVEELCANHIKEILACNPELILLGTGEKQVFPKQEIIAPALFKGVSVEIMHNLSACQTYNMLVGDSREVALALILRGC